jgi:hypothetical protein
MLTVRLHARLRRCCDHTIVSQIVLERAIVSSPAGMAPRLRLMASSTGARFAKPEVQYVFLPVPLKRPARLRV